MSKLKVSAIHDPDNDNLAIGVDTAGKVGIGTSSPANTLDVDSTSSTVAKFQRDSSANGSLTIGFPSQKTTLTSSNSFIFTANGSERLRIPSTGGITFNGDTATANALDDYEEGTWTPTNAGDSTGTLQNAYGDYIKIGNQVTVQGTFLIGTNFTSVSLGGLPFVPTNHPNASTGVHGYVLPRTNGSFRYLQLNNDTTTYTCRSDNSTNASPAVSDGTYRFFATYLTGF